MHRASLCWWCEVQREEEHDAKGMFETTDDVYLCTDGLLPLGGYTILAVPVRGLAPCAALPSSGLAPAGFKHSDGNVLEVPGQVRRHAHPVGTGHASSF